MLALLAGALWVGGPAGAETGTGTSVVVADEAEYRAAVIALSADSNGPHTITLTADIVIDDGTDPVSTGSEDLTIIGNGHVLHGAATSRVLLHSTGGSPCPGKPRVIHERERHWWRLPGRRWGDARGRPRPRRGLLRRSRSAAGRAAVRIGV